MRVNKNTRNLSQKQHYTDIQVDIFFRDPNFHKLRYISQKNYTLEIIRLLNCAVLIKNRDGTS